ncbi:response regulator [Komarekiella sp. 'clone 1']|uniref:Response regulator n=1 Tax=Komarekiella delphini-convector SJRDD-AB1 TaxID=2593771 RepID=A0AA40T2K1_9NOST|nr:response regulator [Komarekiella delphini-convector]MBD6619758.1 response regulator [Komarekiella delphini-convector SJRDD-AB1]
MQDFIKRILICDDVADNSILMKTILEAESCQIEIVESGAAVLAFLETNPCPPDLLILDVMMPKMDGFEVVQRIRQSNKFQFLPILLVTGFAEDDVKKAVDIKIDGFIQKPIDHDAVIAQIQAILDRS